MAVGVWSALGWLVGRMPPVPAMGIAAIGGAVFYWAVLRIFSPRAAGIVDAVLAACLRRDIAAVRVALGGGAVR
jgi:hypothetical protein